MLAADPGESKVEVTRTLARFVVDSRWEDVPPAARREATRSICNWLACAIGGTEHEASVAARSLADNFTGPREATVLGTAVRLDIFQAAWVNGISSHVFDFDDTHLRTVIHPSPPIAPAILALAERIPITGQQFVHAFVLGVDVACRIGNAVCPAHYNVGWHSTSTAGVFGAAAATGKLLDLSELQMCWALGLAGTQASGLRENLNTMGKFLHPGHAARDGMTAAFLAQKNFTASDRILEAPRGFAHVLSQERNLDEVTAELGRRYEILMNTYKPYPCGVVLHPAIEGCIALAKEHGFSAADIEAVSLRVHFLVLEVTGKKHPTVGVDGKFSIYHCVAVAFLDRHVGEHQFTDQRVRDPEVVALGNRVTATVESSIAPDEVFIEVKLKVGFSLNKHVPHALGSLKRPLTDCDLEQKFRDLCGEILPKDRLERLIELCWNLPELANAADLARASAAA
jgi:2-methylcitrate dehydratase PrpD